MVTDEPFYTKLGGLLGYLTNLLYMVLWTQDKQLGAPMFTRYDTIGIRTWRSADAKGTFHKGASLGNGRRLLVVANGTIVEKAMQPVSQPIVTSEAPKIAFSPKFIRVREAAPKRGTPEYAAWQQREHQAYLARVARRAKAKELTPIEKQNRARALAASKIAA